jgi:hypothetical protein
MKNKRQSHFEGGDFSASVLVMNLIGFNKISKHVIGEVLDDLSKRKIQREQVVIGLDDSHQQYKKNILYQRDLLVFKKFNKTAEGRMIQVAYLRHQGIQRNYVARQRGD